MNSSASSVVVQIGIVAPSVDSAVKHYATLLGTISEFATGDPLVPDEEVRYDIGAA